MSAAAPSDADVLTVLFPRTRVVTVRPDGYSKDNCEDLSRRLHHMRVTTETCDDYK